MIEWYGVAYLSYGISLYPIRWMKRLKMLDGGSARCFVACYEMTGAEHIVIIMI